MERDQEISLQPITPLSETVIKSLIEQYRTNADLASKGAMAYFQWLNSWPESTDRKNLDSTIKAFQTAEVLKSILITLGREEEL